MAAYKQPFRPICHHVGCGAPTTHRVYTEIGGSPLGDFCEHHADEKVKVYNEYEAHQFSGDNDNG